LFFGLLLVKPFAKPLILLLLLLSSAANYGMFPLGIQIDSSMMRNLFETNAREAGDFLTPSAFLWVFVGSILPAAALMLTRIETRPFMREALARLSLFIAGILLLAGIVAMSGKEYAAFFRNHGQGRCGEAGKIAGTEE
jgi:lipid A ethanolaminephosphotransferase